MRRVLITFNKTQRWYYYKARARDKTPKIKRPEVLEMIKKLVHLRPATYGYRRIHAILKLIGPRCNSKTVNRYMALNLWLSTNRQKRLRKGRIHEGVVSVAESNTRWSSDITVIKAWNGDKGRLAIVIDCADRQIIAYKWAKSITGNTLIEVVKEALKKRFGCENVPAKGNLEFLSDNGSEFIEKGFRKFLERAGLTVCNTPIRSPESNGISESFFKSLKRDYVYQSVIMSFDNITENVVKWIEDYNIRAPHSALGMIRPSKFYENWKAKPTKK